jgi:hypothetical protein
VPHVFDGKRENVVVSWGETHFDAGLGSIGDAPSGKYKAEMCDAVSRLAARLEEQCGGIRWRWREERIKCR